MKSNFLPSVNINTLKELHAAGNDGEVYDMLVQPLHEELYKAGSFDFVDTLSGGQQLMIGYDYLRTQVGQGGFIQFIQNGYVSLLPQMIGELYKIGADDMAKTLDDVLKVYVLNRELLNKETTVQEFARLYDELKEFEEIEARYHLQNVPAMQLMLKYAIDHINEFATPA